MLKLQQELPKAFHNKLVLAFEGNYSTIQAWSWIDIFNIASPTKLKYIAGLENALHEVEIHQKVEDSISIADHYRWRDGRHIFDTNTQHLRALLNNNVGKLHISVEKWQTYTQWELKPKKLWSVVWQSFLSKKEACFAWKILHRSPTMNEWRHRHRPATSRQRQCKRCMPWVTEDINHALWECMETREIWEWVRQIVSITSSDQT